MNERDMEWIAACEKATKELEDRVRVERHLTLCSTIALLGGIAIGYVGSVIYRKVKEAK